MSALRFKIRKGLDLPINGRPEQKIHPGPEVGRVALIGPDYHGMKPTMHVSVGDRVKVGSTLFVDKKNHGVPFTAPAAGTVQAVHRGEKRVLQSVVIDCEGDEAESFSVPAHLDSASDAEVRAPLLASGLWTALRTRPFSRTPAPDSHPHAIFVAAMDTRPLAPDASTVISEDQAGFRAGLLALSRLKGEKVFLCTRLGAPIPGLDADGVTHASFDGPHPAGLPGTHMHFLAPASLGRMSWTIDYQDVIAIGRLMLTGKLDPRRVISVAGPAVKAPRLVTTQLGAQLSNWLPGEAKETGAGIRMISGSVLSGRVVPHDPDSPFAYLGRFHNQASILEEGGQREFLGWQAPGSNKFSVQNVFISAFKRTTKTYDFNTSTNGSPRAMVPIGSYEKVMPLDIIPTFLLRYLVIGDTDKAQELGALELDEEDLSLCTFVCPGKTEYGPYLRSALTLIEKDG